MKKILEKLRKVRKAERKERKQYWLESMPKYYVQEENVSKSGKVYYPTKVSTLVNPNRGRTKVLFIPGLLMFEWISNKLGL